MSKTSMALLRIAGSVVGLLAGGLALGALFVALFYQDDGSEWGRVGFYVYGSLGFLIGGTTGAAVAATVVQKVLKQRSSFWRALLGAVVGLPIGILCALTGFGIPFVPIPIVAGAVIGSGWKAQPADSTGALS